MRHVVRPRSPYGHRARTIRRLTASLLVPIVLLGGAGAAMAQEGGSHGGGPADPEPDRRRAAVERLAAMMVGDWEGEGWIDQGDGRMTFRGGERVQRKIDGLALLVEGSFATRPPGATADVPIHTTQRGEGAWRPFFEMRLQRVGGSRGG